MSLSSQTISLTDSCILLVLDLICEYCEIYLNCVLFKTKIYTKSYFDKVQKYNIIVYVRFRFTFIFKIKKFFLLRNVKMK